MTPKPPLGPNVRRLIAERSSQLQVDAAKKKYGVAGVGEIAASMALDGPEGIKAVVREAAIWTRKVLLNSAARQRTEGRTMEGCFQARIAKGGKVLWASPRAAADFFAAAEGQRVTITISPGRRTIEQNALLHAIFKEFSERSGYPPAVCKEYLKSAYIEDGRGTSSLDVAEASDFAEFCQAWLSEHL